GFVEDGPRVERENGVNGAAHGWIVGRDFLSVFAASGRTGRVTGTTPATHDNRRGTTMSVTFGADPVQLTDLGTKLHAQVTAIDDLKTAVTTALANTAWVGPSRAAFEAQWTTSFATALQSMQEAFSTAGTECHNRSTLLQNAMGA